MCFSIYLNSYLLNHSQIALNKSEGLYSSLTFFHYFHAHLMSTPSVTNEVSGQDYHIDIGKLIPNITDSDIEGGAQFFSKPDDFGGKAITFLPGTIPYGNNTAAQAARLIGLVIMAGDGINVAENVDALSDLVNCMLTNECLVDPVIKSFMSCNVFGFLSRPPCDNEFKKVVSTIDREDSPEITNCFLRQGFPEGFYNAAPNGPDEISNYYAAEDFDNLPRYNQGALVSCIVRFILPAGEGQGVISIRNIFKDRWETIMFIIDIVESGIRIPGGKNRFWNLCCALLRWLLLYHWKGLIIPQIFFYTVVYVCSSLYI